MVFLVKVVVKVKIVLVYTNIKLLLLHHDVIMTYTTITIVVFCAQNTTVYRSIGNIVYYSNSSIRVRAYMPLDIIEAESNA